MQQFVRDQRGHVQGDLQSRVADVRVDGQPLLEDGDFDLHNYLSLFHGNVQYVFFLCCRFKKGESLHWWRRWSSEICLRPGKETLHVELSLSSTFFIQSLSRTISATELVEVFLLSPSLRKDFSTTFHFSLFFPILHRILSCGTLTLAELSHFCPYL